MTSDRPASDMRENSDGPEMRRLIARLTADPRRALKGFNVWWGSNAPDTVEGRAAAINRAMDTAGPPLTAEEFDRGLGSTPQVNVRDWLKERGL